MLRKQLTFILLCSLLCSSFAADRYIFQTPKQAQQFDLLTHRLRCLVCQNESIANSTAPLAGDLRRDVYSMVLAGKSTKDVQHYMIQRYGDFVTFRPPFVLRTAILWVTPFLLLLIIAGLLLWRSRKSDLLREEKLSSLEEKKLQDLLGEV